MEKKTKEKLWLLHIAATFCAGILMLIYFSYEMHIEGEIYESVAVPGICISGLVMLAAVSAIAMFFFFYEMFKWT